MSTVSRARRALGDAARALKSDEVEAALARRARMRQKAKDALRHGRGACAVCGATGQEHTNVLWPGLVEEWSLTPDEAVVMDRREGTRCTGCGSSIRSRVLALAILVALDQRPPLRGLGRRQRLDRLLEVNTAGHLHPELKHWADHTLGEYPDVDMTRLPYPSDHFDLVVHSDTLEHVPDPVRGIAECLRVLRYGGHLCFTIPIVNGRLTRSRAGEPASYHGTEQAPEFLVTWEYGPDFWLQLTEAGARDIRLIVSEDRTYQAIIVRKH